MDIKREKLHYDVARKLVSGFVGVYHKLDISGAENIPKEGPVLLLSKHQSIKDIFLQGRILGGHVGRPGNWVMKSGLPKYFEKLGGLRIIRPQDVKKSYMGLNSEQIRVLKRAFIKEAKEYRDEVKSAMRDIYSQGELLVLHPEGHRYPYEIGPISMPLINYTNKIRKDAGQNISLVLMGINYENICKFRSKINVKINRLDWDTPNLEKAIKSEIAKLSGL